MGEGWPCSECCQHHCAELQTACSSPSALLGAPASPASCKPIAGSCWGTAHPNFSEQISALLSLHRLSRGRHSTVQKNHQHMDSTWSPSQGELKAQGRLGKTAVPVSDVSIVISGRLKHCGIFTSLFPRQGGVQTCSQHRLVMLQRCSSDTSKGLNNSLTPEKAQATLGSSFFYPQEDGLIDQLGSPQEPLLHSEWGIDGKKKLPVPDFPCCCQSMLMASKLRPVQPRCGHLCYLKSPLTLRGSSLLPGSQNCRMDQVCCFKSHPLWASPVPSNDNNL